MNIAIFSSDIRGHYLEYIHHVYEMAAEDSQNKYYFILPDRFLEIRRFFKWKELNNIEFCLFKSICDKPTDSYWQQCINSLKICSLLKQYLKQYKCEILYVNTIMYLLPFAPVLLKSCNCKVMGIIYKIYLYEDGNLLSRIVNRIKYLLLSKCSLFSNVLVLNDSDSAMKLNEIYATNKFQPIPDPFVKLPVKDDFNFRKIYDIGSDKVVYAHIGALSINKSTIEILTSLKYLDEQEKQHYVFVFAGSVHDEIRGQFYHLLEVLKSEIRIIVEDRFCSYEELASFCRNSDALLIPYKRTSQSSGIIGYASQFGCPVIAPSKGLLGNLVKQYKLGILIDDISPECLVNAYRVIANRDCEKPSEQYCNEHDAGRFQLVLKSCINQIKN